MVDGCLSLDEAFTFYHCYPSVYEKRSAVWLTFVHGWSIYIFWMVMQMHLRKKPSAVWLRQRCGVDTCAQVESLVVHRSWTEVEFLVVNEVCVWVSIVYPHIHVGLVYIASLKCLLLCCDGTGCGSFLFLLIVVYIHRMRVGVSCEFSQLWRQYIVSVHMKVCTLLLVLCLYIRKYVFTASHLLHPARCKCVYEEGHHGGKLCPFSVSSILFLETIQTRRGSEQDFFFPAWILSYIFFLQSKCLVKKDICCAPKDIISGLKCVGLSKAYIMDCTKRLCCSDGVFHLSVWFLL